jgi:hypothetical protein
MASVTTGHEHKTLDGSGFHSIHDFIGQRQYLVVREATHNGTGFDFSGRRTGFGFFDECRKILGTAFRPGANVYGAFIPYHTGSKQPIKIGVVLFQGNKTVGGQQNRSVKRLEILVLMPPGASVISHKMIVFLKSRIVIGRQPLSVGIHIDTCVFNLPEQFFHVL